MTTDMKTMAEDPEKQQTIELHNLEDDIDDYSAGPSFRTTQLTFKNTDLNEPPDEDSLLPKLQNIPHGVPRSIAHSVSI
ncbi:UNVERIFIED_CONTAM: hypothetical protein NCL1_52742 [Trichonephila clavipes]